MVEMLGVLAVIGVLSVAGIAGYNAAMQSYRTNEILNATSMFYVLAMSQNQGNGPSEKIDYSKVGGTNPSGATLEYENNAITITFNDAKDCTMAKNKLGDKATDDCANKKLKVSFGETTSATEDPEPIGGESCEVAGQQRCNYTEKTLYECSGGIWTGLDSCGNPDNNRGECLKGRFKCNSDDQIIKCKEGWWGSPETDTEGKCQTGTGTHYRCEMSSIFLYDSGEDSLGSCDYCEEGVHGWADSPEEFASNCR